MFTLSKAHFSWVYSANLFMKESSFSGMMTLLEEMGSQPLGWGFPLSVEPSFSQPLVTPLSVPESHLRVSTGRGSKLPSASTVAFFSVLDEYEAST